MKFDVSVIPNVPLLSLNSGKKKGTRNQIIRRVTQLSVLLPEYLN